MAKQNLSMGRKKTGCTKILSKSHRHVTFSKRRSGLFKKASELCTLCGAEIAIVVFSPAGKIFSFGHPNVEPILDRFLTGNPNLGSKKHQLIEAHQNANVRELNNYLTQIINQVEAEKKYGEALDHMRRANQRQCWWDAPINELGLHELEQLRVSIEELKKNVAKQANKILFESAPNSLPHLEMNGIEYVEFLESKPKVDAASTIPNAYDFAYGYLL
ncbi:agamous-like MADS-box protein AGL61 [Quercus lobata]|uniref:MADS-box domain-containing protein n=1 Tax=Quercus lobata TaxID=97700 RepID=A0A7N2MXL7_QUELO|nr:agamous-like MADS-box protein AGL61 [Quercus lobata]